MNKPLMHALAIALALALVSPSLAAPGPMDLSKEQRQQLRALRDSLDGAGATPEACRAAHDQLFQSWGLEAPPMPGGRGPCGKGMGSRDDGDQGSMKDIGPRLNQEQRQQLRALRDSLDDAGATPQACRAAHDQLFQSWGVEAPPMPGGRGPCGKGERGSMKGKGPRLSQEQRQELRALRDRLDAEGATPMACRSAHDQLFQSWGMEAPPMPGGRGPCGKGRASANKESASTPVEEANVLGLGNHPNPFNPSTEIRFTLPEAGKVRVAVYDMKGQLVQELVDGRQSAGEHRVAWEGRDAKGREVASGAYVLQADWKGHRESHTITLLR